MDEARRVLERLERIERMERGHASAEDLLDELRALVHEAEAWVKAEHAPQSAAGTLERCRAALTGPGTEEVVLLAR